MTSHPTRFEELSDNVVVREAADYLRLAPETVYQMVRDGRIRALKGTGRRVVIHRSELARLVGGSDSQ